MQDEIAGSLIQESLWRKAYGLLVLRFFSSGMGIGNKIWPYSSAQCCFFTLLCSCYLSVLFVQMNGKERGRTEGIRRAVALGTLSGSRELKYFAVRTRRESTMVLQVSDLKGDATHHHSTISTCHTPFPPIYSHPAIENHLKTHDWNGLLSLFKFRNNQISPPAFRLAWILVWCVALRDQVAY